MSLVITLSDHITPGGEPTTAQLTPPGSKTTGDFDPGFILDDQNPTDALDLSVDSYTEFEWCLRGTVAGLYQLRIEGLDTYDEVAEINIGDSLIIADSSHGHTADNLVISSIDLVVSDCSHSHTADSLVLGGVDFVVASCEHGHTADNIVLGINLVVQDCSHGHTADNLVLTNLLTVNDCVHGHTADGNFIITSDFAGNDAAETSVTITISLMI